MEQYTLYTNDNMDFIATSLTNISKPKFYRPSKPVPIHLGGVKCFNCDVPRHRLFINYYCTEDFCKKCCKLNYVHYEHETRCTECKDSFASAQMCIACDMCRLYCCGCLGKTVKLKDVPEVFEDHEQLGDDDIL
jgi:hypothetical protein